MADNSPVLRPLCLAGSKLGTSAKTKGSRFKSRARSLLFRTQVSAFLTIPP